MTGASGSTSGRISGSFRDPDGFVFRRDGVVLRQINPSFAPHLGLLRESGILESELTLPVEWLGASAGETADAIETMRPEALEFVSYPYEWSFGMLKDAALLTLGLAKEARGRGLVLKDASAFNVQFQRGKPVHIDSLSFERIVPGEPWVAYGQFCRHFLAPLALIARTDPDLLRLFRLDLDGIPLPIASRLLPGMTRFSPGLAVHLHAHARTSGAKAVEGPARKGALSETAHLALLDSLTRTVEGIHWKPEGTTWADYTEDNNYDAASYAAKRGLVAEMLGAARRREGGVCWDLGANTGDFSRLAVERGFRTVAWDLDPGAVERNYARVRSEGETRLLPLLQDLGNPSPNLGWALSERDSLVERADADVLLALALVHHLRIGGLVPLVRVAEFLADLAPETVIEWVSKEDSQVRRLLASREDVFSDYDEAGFEAAFATRFETVRKVAIPGTVRTLYHLRRRA